MHGLFTPVGYAAEQTGWQIVLEHDSVTVWRRDIASEQILPDLRAKRRIEGDLFHAMAAIIDSARSPEWMPNCSEAVEMESDDGKSSLVYSVTNFPWPVVDRDTIVKVDIETIISGQIYEVVMTAQPT